MHWFYHNPVSVYAGLGVVRELGKYLEGFGKVLLLTSPGMVSRGSASWLLEQVKAEQSCGAVTGLGGFPAGSAAESVHALESAHTLESAHALKSADAFEPANSVDFAADKKVEAGTASAGSVRGWLMETMDPNPDVLSLQVKAKKLANEAVEAIVAFGGGSVMDSAKVLAVALANPGCDIRYFFSHHHEEADALPYYCIPTTAGTGAEMTPFGTVWDKEARKKYSFSARNLFARAAFLDPATTVSLPPKETLYGAMDAMSHSLETLWNRNASIIGQSLARSAIAAICQTYPMVAAAPDNHAARLRLQEASALAGMAISQSRSALAHSMSYPLTSHYGVPHGLACSFTLSAIIRLVTAKGLWANPQDETLAMEAAMFMDGLQLPAHVAEYCRAEEVLALAGEMFAPGRVENFIVPVTSDEVLRLLRASLACA